jgi:RNA polymerase sigma factor (sigma-70 family)
MTAAARAGERWRPAPFGVLGDERLAQRAGAGDERAFAVVYERYHQILYRYCRSILNNEADAQDALQSSFAAAFASLRAGQRDAPIRPWLFRIAHNESISILRRRRPALELSQAPDYAASSLEDQIAERAALSALMRDLHELTDRQRSALVLRELSGLSHQEIAITLGTSVGAAKQTIFEARQSLFEFAEGRAMACDEIRKTMSDADGRSLRSRRVRAHLRECGGCAAFAAAIPARTGELRALTPALPGVAAAGLLGRIAVSSAGHGGGAGLARLAAGATLKTASAGAGFSANALAGVAVVATATAGVSVGLDRLMHATPQREPVRLYAPASPARAAPARHVSLLGAASSRRPGADGTRGAAAPGMASTGFHPAVIGDRRSGGATGSRTRAIHGSKIGKGSVSAWAGGQTGSGAGYSDADGHGLWAGPARARSDQAAPPGTSVSAPPGSADPAHGNSWRSGGTGRAGSGAARPSNGNQWSSGNGNQGGGHGSGKPSWAGSGQSGAGKSSSNGSDSPAGTSPPNVPVNAPVPASVSATAGSASAALGAATTAVGNVTSTAVGTVTSTVAAALSGKHHHRDSS